MCLARVPVYPFTGDMTRVRLAGGKQLHDPEDLGFMYCRAVKDPDGNGFGPMWMAPKAAAQNLNKI